MVVTEDKTPYDSLRLALEKHLRNAHHIQQPLIMSYYTIFALEQAHAAMHRETKQNHPISER